MNTIMAFLLIFLAGIINGSYALPTKYAIKWRFENIWLNYALWGFVILPWLTMFCLAPQVFQIYASVPIHLLLMIVIGGLIFGIGQMCFAISVDIIGMSLGFVINLGIGIGLGFALPLIIQHSEKIFTSFGFVTLIGTTLAIAGLIVSSHAGILRDKYKNKNFPNLNKKNSLLGIMLAIAAGLSSASQNFVFSYTQSVQSIALAMGANDFAAANIIWPGYLLCGFIPYMFYMLYLHCKNNSFSTYLQRESYKYYLYAIIMGIFWYGSLLLYCKASQLIGAMGPIIGWSMFMVLIILSSSFWGWMHNEWQDCGKHAKNVMKAGLGLLIIAVSVLGYSAAI